MHLPVCDIESETKLCQISLNLPQSSLYMNVSRKQAFWEKWFSDSHSSLTDINEFLTKIYTFLN